MDRQHDLLADRVAAFARERERVLGQQVAAEAVVRRRRVTGLAAAASPAVVASTVAKKVVLQADFANIVGSSAGTEIEVVIDPITNQIRLYLP